MKGFLILHLNGIVGAKCHIVVIEYAVIHNVTTRVESSFYWLLFTVENFYCFAFRLNSLFTSTVQGSVRITADVAPVHLSVSRSISPSLMNMNSRYLKLLHLGSNSLPTPKRINPPFSSRAPSDFPGAPHSSASCPSAHRRSQSLTDRMKSSDTTKEPLLLRVVR